jgi:hypothetical protein
MHDQEMTCINADINAVINENVEELRNSQVNSESALRSILYVVLFD